MAVKTFAAIEVGSSQLSMKIYEISKKLGFKELDHVRYSIGLGVDTYSKGVIGFEKVNELCEVLKKFRFKMDEYQVDDYYAVGGSALREAKNRDLIVDQIFIKTGLKVDIISNAQQRFFILKSVAYKMKNFEQLISEGAAVVDLGAGSLQVSCFKDGILASSHNLKLGSIRIREILSEMEEHTTSFVGVMEDYIGNDMRTLGRLRLKNHKIRHMIVVGEEFSSIINYVSMTKNKEFLTGDQFNKIYNKLLKSNPSEIADKYGIPYELASVIVPSSIIYKKLLDSTTVEKLWEPQADMCDGLAVDYSERVEKYVLPHDFERDLINFVRNMTKKYESNEEHIQNVEMLSLKLFDGMKKISGLNSRHRLLLRLAAMLHDCGKYISMPSSIKASYELILLTEIIGLSEIEKEMVAHIVLYNSYSEIPDYEKEDLCMTKEDFIAVIKMAAMLRLCNSMDRSHRQKIENIRISIKGNELKITADTIYDLTLEEGTVWRRRQMFEEIFGLVPVLRQKRNL